MSTTEHRGGFDRKNLEFGGIPDPTTTDRRALRTRQALHEALMQLVVERGYDEISVGDIVEAANIGRSTFYAHFTDKDDLLRSMAGTLRAVLLAEHAQLAGQGPPSQRVLGFTRFMTQHLRDQHDLYQAVMRGRAGPIIFDMIRHALCDVVRKELPPTDGPPSREFTVQYLVGAFLSVVTWWLDRGARETPAEIEAAFRTLAGASLEVTQPPVNPS